MGRTYAYVKARMNLVSAIMIGYQEKVIAACFLCSRYKSSYFSLECFGGRNIIADLDDLKNLNKLHYFIDFFTSKLHYFANFNGADCTIS